MESKERHGHVRPRLDGMAVQCGGLMDCQHCRQELTEMIGPTKSGWTTEAIDLNACDTATEVMIWACRVREFSGELSRAESLLADLVAIILQTESVQSRLTMSLIGRVKKMMPFLPCFPG